MDLETEFPMLNLRERKAIRHYLKIESDFMPKEDYYTKSANISTRNLAVTIIANYWQQQQQGVEDMDDAFVPYLAINYFERYASRNYPYFDDRLIRLIAIACLTIAAKMRNKSFSLTSFLDDVILDNYSDEAVRRMELRILNGLEWRMQPVTPFCFLNYFYPTFKAIGGFDRRSINQIIIQAQGEGDFINYKPSQIAYSSFLAAARIAYPLEFRSIDKPEGLKHCYRGLVALCRNKHINIESAKLETTSSSNEFETELEAEIDEEETMLVSILEIVPSAEAAPKRLMNFDLTWPTGPCRLYY